GLLLIAIDGPGHNNARLFGSCVKIAKATCYLTYGPARPTVYTTRAVSGHVRPAAGARPMRRSPRDGAPACNRRTSDPQHCRKRLPLRAGCATGAVGRMVERE